MANCVTSAALNSYLTQSIVRQWKIQESLKEETVPPTHKKLKVR